ncbi:MAG: uracil-DNA glycosylase [Chloroflexota bacterium]|nr:uracil-DNA glycosylase [Chloroflexota bacterium]
MTEAERRAALEAIADEVRVCTRCRLHETRTKAVPGEGDASTEVMFVGEGPGMNEDREGRPFVGRAGGLLVTLLGHIGWFRDDVFITNIVKCRPPGNRDPEPDEIAACAPYLERQLQALDPSVVVTLGRYSMGRFMPGVRISQAHGTTRIADPETGARDATVFAMYHPAAALRTPAIERESYQDVALIPTVLTEARARRAERRRTAAAAHAAPSGAAAHAASPAPGDPVAPEASGAMTTPAPHGPAATPNLPAGGDRYQPGEDSHAAEPASSPTPPETDPAADQLSLF